MARVNTTALRATLMENRDVLIELLEDLGFKNPRPHGSDAVKCGFDEESTGNAILINGEGYYTRFSHSDDSGDIMQLFQNKTGKSFKKIASIIEKKLKGEKINYVMGTKKEKTKNSFIDSWLKSMDYDDGTVPESVVLPESTIQPRETLHGKEINWYMLAKDFITLETQSKYKIWFDHLEQRICFNWRNPRGELVGCVGRSNLEEIPEGMPKYFPVTPDFKKGYNLFGLSENMETISETKTAVVFEAEKSVLQLDSYGKYNAVAIGGSSITKYQLRLLKSVGVERIVLAFDSDFDWEYFVEEYVPHIKEFKHFKLYALRDEEGKYMKPEDKLSPSDLGKLKYLDMAKNMIKKI